MVAKRVFLLSWVLLTVVAVALAFFAIVSTGVAYGSAPDHVTPNVTIEQLGTAGDGVVTALHGRRATAATWALGYAILFAFVILVPYRHGERWAWWAMLISLGVSQLASIARVLTLGATQGAGSSALLLTLGLVGLLAGAPYIFSRKSEA